MSFKKRLLICLIIVAVCPLIIAFVWLVNRSSQTIRSQSYDSTERLLNSYCMNLDLMLDTASVSILDILSSVAVIDLLQGIRDGSYDANTIEQVQGNLQSIQSLNNASFENVGIYLDETESTVIASYRNDHSVSGFYDQVADRQGKLSWIICDNLQGTKDIFLAGAALRATTGDVVGMVYIKIRYSWIASLIENASYEDGEELLLIQENGVIMSSVETAGQEEHLFSMIRQEQTQPNQLKEIWIDNTKQLLGTAEASNGWTLVNLMPFSKITNAVLKDLQSLMIIVLFSLMGAAVLAITLSHSAYRPVSKLARLVDHIDRNTLGTAQLSVEKEDELGQLANSFNMMMERINSLISEVEQEKEAKFTAQMSALRAQINPHFLYNTLNMIKCLAVSGDSREAEHICVCLIRLLRTSIGNDKECISLDEELSYVKNYTEILRLRVDKQFELIDDIDDRFYSCMVPKFMLQPIVENSIIHGFENETIHNTIILSAKEGQGILEISVTDNGRGIEKSRVRLLEESLKNGEGLKFSHVGILNVDERIKHIYGCSYGLQIKSYEDNGTKVIIKLPLTTAGGTEDKSTFNFNNG